MLLRQNPLPCSQANRRSTTKLLGKFTNAYPNRGRHLLRDSNPSTPPDLDWNSLCTALSVVPHLFISVPNLDRPWWCCCSPPEEEEEEDGAWWGGEQSLLVTEGLSG